MQIPFIDAFEQISQNLQRLILQHHVTGIILLYHRTALLEFDPINVAITPQEFEQQMRYIQEQCIPSPLSSEFLTDKQRTRKMRVAVTFDDGYVDNLAVAKPILAKYDIPATFFICSGYLSQKKQYWWDNLTSIIFENPAPAKAS